MAKINLIGFLFIIGGFLLIIFQGIAMFMGTKPVWKSITLVDLLSENVVSWFDDISIYVIYQAAHLILTTPVYILLFVVGGLLLVIKSFMWRR